MLHGIATVFWGECQTVRSTKDQNQQHPCCLRSCMCRFPNIYFVWHRFVRISLHLIEGLQYSKRTSCPVCSQVYWRMRAEPSCGLNVLFSLLLMASGLSARSHSASSHLLRTKKGLLGVHAAKLHSKGIGQTPASCCFSSKYLLFFLFNAIIT